MFFRESKTVEERIKRISFFDFLKHYFSMGFYRTIDTLEKEYQTEDFEINLAFITLFYIIQNKKSVKQILTAKTQLGYHYHNFNAAHGHSLNILALEAEEKIGDKNPLWQHIHKALAKSVGDAKIINALMDKHIYKLFAKTTFELDIEFENCLLDFWCEYLFGETIDCNAFKNTRRILLEAARFSYYDNQLKDIPYLGNLSCRFYGYLQGDKWQFVDDQLKFYLANSKEGLFSRFKQHLIAAKFFPHPQLEKVLLDNAFDFILVFDFIHNAMYESLVAVLKQQLDNLASRKLIYAEGLKNAFLFPFRSRVTTHEVDLGSNRIAKGKLIFINLLKSGFTHSYGPRSCVGTGVAYWIQNAIWRHLENKELRILKVTQPTERLRLSNSLDIPYSPERYQISWKFPKDYLQKILPAFTFKGRKNFYDVLKAFEKPDLLGYITAIFVEKIKLLKLNHSDLCIAAPELRGVPIAACVAHTLRVPLIIIRASGKIPGETISETRVLNHDSMPLEISTKSNVRKDVILIDDGIAGGSTAIAACHLLEKMGSTVQAILAPINHKYTPRISEINQYNIQTLFDFENGKPEDEKDMRSDGLLLKETGRTLTV